MQMGLLTFSGGIHPYEGKDLTKDKPVREYLPKGECVYPLSQHIGAPAVPIVKRGDRVLVGQKIAEAGGFVSANIHSSISGTVKMIEPRMTSGGNKVNSIVIENDGLFETVDFSENVRDLSTLYREDIKDMIKEAGIVGMGGAGFPSHVKLSPRNEEDIEYIIVNGAECEPYLTSDYRRMLEETDKLILGLQICVNLFDKAKGIIAIEDNKPDAIEALTRIADDPKMDPNDEVRVLKLHASYPQGAEKVLVQAATGRKVPAGGLPADVGCLVMNIGSVSFLASYMRTGMPLTMKRVTVDGSAVQNPQNVIVPIGTKIREVMEFCGGYKEEPQKLIMGGPMMGLAQYDVDVSVGKGTGAMLAFADKEEQCVEDPQCIRCGKCVGECAIRLEPIFL